MASKPNRARVSNKRDNEITRQTPLSLNTGRGGDSSVPPNRCVPRVHIANAYPRPSVSESKKQVIPVERATDLHALSSAEEAANRHQPMKHIAINNQCDHPILWPAPWPRWKTVLPCNPENRFPPAHLMKPWTHEDPRLPPNGKCVE